MGSGLGVGFSYNTWGGTWGASWGNSWGVLVVEQPTGGWKRRKKQDYFPPDLSREEREARIRQDRIRRGILGPEDPETPPKPPKKLVQRDDSLDLDFLESDIDFARLELSLIKAEMERKFSEPKPGISDKEVKERLLYALEYAEKRRIALLLLLL